MIVIGAKWLTLTARSRCQKSDDAPGLRSIIAGWPTVDEVNLLIKKA